MDLKRDAILPTYSEESSNDDDLEDNSSRKRKRLPKISCEICKARKVKCDKAEPACGWCARNNRICIYKERRKVSLKASYGVELEDKIKSIESHIQHLTQRLEEHVSSSTCGKIALPALNNHGQAQSLLSPHSNYSQSQTLPQQSLNSRATEGSRSNHPAQQFKGLSVSSLLASAGSFSPKSIPSWVSGPVAHIRNDELPPQDMLFHIVDMYFKHVNTWAPILDRNATLNSLFQTPGTIDEEDKVLLHGIVAVTLRFCRDARLPDEVRQRYREISRQKVQLHALGNPSIQCLKALILVTVDVLGTSNGPQGWNLIALLARNIVWMGLHVEKSVYLAHSRSSETAKASQIPNLLQPNTWTEDEGWRRLYWLTYILDRYATVATSFNFVLDEEESDRPLPCRYDLFSKNQAVETRWFQSADSMETSTNNPENLGSFSYHCEVLRILSQIHTFLRRPVDINSASDIRQWRDTYRELDNRLKNWLSELPGEYGKISQLCHSDPGSRVSNWIMIHAAFVTAVIRLHSVAAYPSVCSHLFKSSYNASQRCLAAVQSLVAIAQDVIDTSMLDLLGPLFAFSLWTSSRLLLVHAATTQTPIDEKIWFLISTLGKMGQYWKVARSWAELLNRLVREGKRADEDNRAGQFEVLGKTYHEMRRYAHDLSALTSRRPRTVLDPPATRFASSNELEYFEVFEWFSYPKLPSDRTKQMDISSGTYNNDVDDSSNSTHNDNTFYTSNGNSNNSSIGNENSSNNNGIPRRNTDANSNQRIPRIVTATIDSNGGGGGNGEGSSNNTNTTKTSNNNNINIATNKTSNFFFFSVPDPNSDWLDFKQPYEFEPPCE